MSFERFLAQHRPLLAKIARIHVLDPDDLPGLSFLAWHEAQATYRPDAGASLETWAVRRFDVLCLRERSQGRYGLDLDDGDAALPEAALSQLSISDEAAIFSILEPEPEQTVAERNFFGLHGKIVAAALDGCSVAEIAARARITPRRVNQVIAEMTQKRSPGQTDLFDFDLAPV